MHEYFKDMFNYDFWANNMLQAKFEQQYPVNPRISELFSHILSVQRIWLDRCLGQEEAVQRFQDRLPGETQSDMLSYHLAWIDFIEEMEADDLSNIIRYTNSRGETYEDKLQDILAQVINHGIHHRGSIIVLMKEEGYSLPQTDYIVFKRTGR